MRQAISRVRDVDKHKCVMLCIEKERQGFELLKKVHFADGFWTAIYRRVTQ